ncbi:MAG: hypothetical protein R2711_13510 [Acidimicrobiales bacterium]
MELLAQRPVARRVGILIEELGDETVLYDPVANRFVRLNGPAHLRVAALRRLDQRGRDHRRAGAGARGGGRR